MAPTATKSRRSTTKEARMPSLKRANPHQSALERRTRMRALQWNRPSICNAYSLKDEFIQRRVGTNSLSKIGKGGWGKVFLMYERQSLKAYAVKEIRKDADEEEQDYAERVYDEFEIACRLNHPNVVKTFRLRARRCTWCVVMEHCANGAVFECVMKGQLKMDEKLCLFKQLLHGVEYMHSQGVAHRDIKLENLLLNKVGHLKIADFGVSTTGDPSYGSDALRWCSDVCGTPLIMPPEVGQELYDGRAFDVWSCAMTMLIMLSTDYPLNPDYVQLFEERMGPLCHSICEEARENGGILYAVQDLELQSLLFQMLHPYPNMRLTISQALRHPSISKIECCCPAPNSRDKGPLPRHNHGPLR